METTRDSRVVGIKSVLRAPSLDAATGGARGDSTSGRKESPAWVASKWFHHTGRTAGNMQVRVRKCPEGPRDSSISLLSCQAGAPKVGGEGKRKAKKSRALKKQSGYPVGCHSASRVEAATHRLIWRWEGSPGPERFGLTRVVRGEARFGWFEGKIWSKEGKQTKDNSSNTLWLEENKRWDPSRQQDEVAKGVPGRLGRLSVPLQLRQWSHGLWVRAPYRALCWPLRAWDLLRFLCLPLSLPIPRSRSASPCLSKVNEH